MATVHFERTVHKRGSSTVTVAQRLDYIQREGQYDPATARVRYLERDGKTERLRDDLIAKDVHNLPAWAKGNPATFFTQAEQQERSNGVAYTEWKFSLPRELSREQQLTAARDLMTLHFGATHPYIWAMHEPLAADSGPNPHIHCLWSARTLDGIERSPEQFFKQWQRAHPERGGARKDPALIAVQQGMRERQTYTDVLNLHLDRAGSLERLHPGSHKDRGLERAPEPHVLPSDSNAAKFKHEITDEWAKVLASRAERPAHAAVELADAQAYWQARSAWLGITVHVSHALALERIAEGRQRSLSQAPHRPGAYAVEQARLGLEQSISGLQTYEHQLTAEAALERAYIGLGKGRHPQGIARVEALLAEGKTHGIDIAPSRVPQGTWERAQERSPERTPGPRRTIAQAMKDIAASLDMDEASAGGGLRARLHEKERDLDQDRGMSW